MFSSDQHDGLYSSSTVGVDGEDILMSSSSISASDDDNDENRLDSSESQLLAAQKSLIYKHPLFPVLVYVLERCEQATINPSLLLTQEDCVTTSSSSSSSSFEHNLKIFLSKNPTILNYVKSDQDDSTSIIDNFYIDAMQVLRIHLLELDKVNDLCRDFCQRYIACLKVKLNANNIFTDDEDEDDEEDYEEESAMDDDDESNEETEHENDTEDSHSFAHERLGYDTRLHGKRTISTDESKLVYNNYGTQFDGQTPLSQIIASGTSKINDTSSFLFDSICNKRRKQSTAISSPSNSSKRGVLPKSATSIMRSWLFQHIVHPYPTEDEKRAISVKTNLSLLQVNNWFINARRRILQPMLEASNPDLAANKKKRRHESSSDYQHHSSQQRQMSNINRYWPSNLAHFDVTNTDQNKK